MKKIAIVIALAVALTASAQTAKHPTKQAMQHKSGIVGMDVLDVLNRFGAPDRENVYDSGREEQWVYESGLILYIDTDTETVTAWQRQDVPHQEHEVVLPKPDEVDATNAKNREQYKTPDAVVSCPADDTPEQCDIRKTAIATIRKIDADGKNTPNTPTTAPVVPLAERLHQAEIKSKCEIEASNAAPSAAQHVLDACMASSK